ncbi:MAG: hypothetical protein R3F30_06555 [Planctomycetota bacterium]
MPALGLVEALAAAQESARFVAAAARRNGRAPASRSDSVARAGFLGLVAPTAGREHAGQHDRGLGAGT